MPPPDWSSCASSNASSSRTCGVPRDWIAAEEQLAAAQADRRPAPPPPEWLIEHGIGTGRPAVRVHTGECWDTRTRCKPATADTARRALAEGVHACPQCRPDTALGMLE